MYRRHTVPLTSLQITTFSLRDLEVLLACLVSLFRLLALISTPSPDVVEQLSASPGTSPFSFACVSRPPFPFRFPPASSLPLLPRLLFHADPQLFHCHAVVTIYSGRQSVVRSRVATFSSMPHHPKAVVLPSPHPDVIVGRLQARRQAVSAQGIARPS